MVRRITQVVAALMVIVSSVAFDTGLPAEAADPLTSTMFCGYSSGLGYAVGFYGPQVTGEIASTSEAMAFVYWKPELYWYDTSARQWKFWKDWSWRSAEFQVGTGPGFGGTTGTAGPSWYGSDGWNNQFSFSAPPGYWYAVKQVFYDRGVWSSTWAQTQTGLTYCATG